MSVAYEQIGRTAVLTINNPPVNALGSSVRLGLQDGVKRAHRETGVDSIVIMGGGRTFPAGADVTEFSDMTKAMCEPRLPQLCTQIESSPKPVVAALHGTCYGGGLEIALGCHYRIALASARVSFPEVHLGILPGAGGTQRLPRVVSIEHAIDMITTGRPVRAATALEWGLLDQVVPDNAKDPRALLKAALQCASTAVASSSSTHLRRVSAKPLHDLTTAPATLAAARTRLEQRNPHFEAPLRCIDALQAAYTHGQASFARGMQAEEALIASLMQSPQARALQHLFFAERLAARIPGLPNSPAATVNSVGVIGGGTMGCGIAQCFLDKHIATTLIDTSTDAIARALATIKHTYAVRVKRNTLTSAQVESRLALLSLHTELKSLAHCDLVIEAVFENMQIKQKVFKELDLVCKSDAVLASNTSTLDIEQIASVTSRPDQVVGMHFFAPANVMRLLENIRTPHTSARAILTAMETGKRIGKLAVLARNCDGFIGNRMIEFYGREAMFMLEEGAFPEQIDRVMKQYGMPMGPFEMADLSGNDIGWRIRQGKGYTTAKTLPFRYSALGDKLCELGRFGQKTGKGWYSYAEKSRKGTVDERVHQLIVQHSEDKGFQRRVIEDTEILQRCLFPLMNEGYRLLKEGIAIRASDIDIVLCYGYGYPRTKGGPLFDCEHSYGLARVHSFLSDYLCAHPTSLHFEPAPLLTELVERGIGVREWEALRDRTERAKL